MADGVYHEPKYGSFLNIIGCLPDGEYQEYWSIRNRKHRSAQAETRMQELSDKAHQLWEHREPRTPENDLSLYAQEIGAKMRARQDAGSEEPRPTGS